MIYHPDSREDGWVNEVAETGTTGQEPQEFADYKWAWFGISQIDGTELCHSPLGWQGRRAGLKWRKQMDTLQSTRHLLCKETQ